MQDQEKGFAFDDDPTLSACCIRDLEERKQAAAWKAELKRNDPVERAEAMRKVVGGAESGGQHHRHHQSVPNFPRGKLVETNECNLGGIINKGMFVVCLALPEFPTLLESAMRNWMDGFDSVLLIHRFKPSACRNCYLDENLKLPALVVWSQGERVMLIDRNRLEAETETSIIARLTLAKRQCTTNLDDDDDDDEETGTGRNSYFKCEKQGCTRTFHHVHVANRWKNSTFENHQQDDDSHMSDSDEEDDL